MLKHFTEKLKELLNNPLPAMEAHKKMAPQIRLSSLLKKEPQNARKSAVLILFYQKDNELYFPLIKRTDYGGIMVRSTVSPAASLKPTITHWKIPH